MYEKSQLEAVKLATSALPVAHAPTPKPSGVKSAALEGAALGAVLGAIKGIGNADPDLPLSKKTMLVLGEAAVGAAGFSAAFANDRYGMESASARGTKEPSVTWRLAKGFATNAVVGGVTAAAIKSAAGIQFGSLCASYASRADAHERRARSARSARSATLHSERAAELRARVRRIRRSRG